MEISDSIITVLVKTIKSSVDDAVLTFTVGTHCHFFSCRACKEMLVFIIYALKSVLKAEEIPGQTIEKISDFRKWLIQKAAKICTKNKIHPITREKVDRLIRLLSGGNSCSEQISLTLGLAETEHKGSCRPPVSVWDKLNAPRIPRDPTSCECHTGKRRVSFKSVYGTHWTCRT